MNDTATAAGRPTRRRFMKTVAGAAVGAVAAPAVVRGRNLNDRLNIAMIGTGGRGGFNLKQPAIAAENIVALCDVYEPAVERAAQLYPGARRYRDFRRVYDRAHDFDAVVVSTTEHTHAFATLPALQLGKHVYCEKPLTYNIWEARVIREAAAKAKVATQMGNQNHSNDNYRCVVDPSHPWACSGAGGVVAGSDPRRASSSVPCSRSQRTGKDPRSPESRRMHRPHKGLDSPYPRLPRAFRNNEPRVRRTRICGSEGPRWESTQPNAWGTRIGNGSRNWRSLQSHRT
jgi:hypothetical protein